MSPIVWLIDALKADIVGFTNFGKFPGKPENSGKFPVSREAQNPGKSTPLGGTPARWS